MFRKALVATMLLMLLVALAAGGCGSAKITSLDQLAGKTFAVPSGTVADKLVLSKFADAKFKYYDTALDACLAVKKGEADAAAYDQPILKNIAAKNEGLKVLPDMITVDDYGFAFALGNDSLKATFDQVVQELNANGGYKELLAAWLPEKGEPAGTGPAVLKGANGVLIFGTAAVTEPFSYLNKDGKVVGLDIELAYRVADKLGYQIEVVNMPFGDLIPALTAGTVDMIGACITITTERAKSVLFSEPYYKGGIAALVKE
jgi:polar amino acid transport system substrate-binding protein